MGRGLGDGGAVGIDGAAGAVHLENIMENFGVQRVILRT